MRRRNGYELVCGPAVAVNDAGMKKIATSPAGTRATPAGKGVGQ
jgi:hypothetical protein